MRNLILIFTLAISMSAFAAPSPMKANFMSLRRAATHPVRITMSPIRPTAFIIPAKTAASAISPASRTGTTASDFTMSGTVYTDRTDGFRCKARKFSVT